MPLRRQTGSDHLIRQAAATRSSGAVTLRREVHAPMANSMQGRPARERSWSTGHDQPRREAVNGLLENHVPASRERIGRPRFTRLHASIAERSLDWAWQRSPEVTKSPGEGERSGARRADPGFSSRAWWFGGTAFVLLAAGVISAIATVQANRPLPFEAWARRDLMQGAYLVGGRSADVMGAGQFAGPPLIGRHSVASALGAKTAPASIPVTAERDPADAALAWGAGGEPTEVDIAALGPILANAADAARLTAEWHAGPTAAAEAAPESRSERLLRKPPRPVFKPTLAASSQPEADATARPRSRRP